MIVPKREDLTKEWVNVLKNVCMKGDADSFDVKIPNKRIYACDFHFKDENVTIILVLDLLLMLNPKPIQIKFYHHIHHHQKKNHLGLMSKKRLKLKDW